MPIAIGLTHIGCWCHAREASKATKFKGKDKTSNKFKADVALRHIKKIYAIERQIKDLSEAE